MDGSQWPHNNKPQWLQGGGEQCYQEPFYQNGTGVWGQIFPQQLPLGYQYIFGGSSGNCNVVLQTSWAMNSTYNQWGGLVGDYNMIPQQKNYENSKQSGPKPSQFHYGGPRGTTYHVIVGPNYGPNSRGVLGTLYPMSSTNCGPNFIGPQGTTYATTRPSCGPNFVRPFPQPYQVLPPPPIS